MTTKTLNPVEYDVIWGRTLTVRLAESLQQEGKTRSIEPISVTQMTTRVEFWLTENLLVT